MPEVPEALPLAPVGVKQGRNAEGKVPLETFLTLYLKSIGLFLRIEKKIKKRGNQLKPLHKLWLIATTPACHSRNSVKLVFKVDMLRVFFFLFGCFLRLFIKVDLRNPRCTHLIMDPYRESMTWNVWEQVKNGIMTARQPQKTHNKISQGISLSAADLCSPPWEQLYHSEFSNAI